MPSLLAGVVVAVALALAALPPAAEAAESGRVPRASSLVALGDSYAAGVGAGAYRDASGDCHRSGRAHPVRVANRLGARLRFRACDGATVGDVRSGQLKGLSSSRYVSVTAGGNDAGFAEVLTECAQPWWAGDCGEAVADARKMITNVLPRRLSRLYAAIGNRAPKATGLVVGYPRLFNGEDCDAGTFFSPTEMRRLNATTDLLARVSSRRATAAGFGYVDPRRAFRGHAVCADAAWVNGLSNPVWESYHPNRDGQAAYTRLVLRALG